MNHLVAQACGVELMNKVPAVNADEFRKGLRIAQCMSSYFEMIGLPMRRAYMDKLAEKFLAFVDAGAAPPFNGVQAAHAVEQAIAELWPTLTEAEQQDYVNACNAFSARMVEAAPEEGQKHFAQIVAREWAKDL
jgi:hypothetical protein